MTDTTLYHVAAAVKALNVSGILSATALTRNDNIGQILTTAQALNSTARVTAAAEVSVVGTSKEAGADSAGDT